MEIKPIHDKSQTSAALIGHTGFVGSTLKKQLPFTDFYRSTDIGNIAGRDFDLVVCAGAPAQKWLANREPEADRAAIDQLIDHLGSFICRRFILISTVDVFCDPNGVDENSPVSHEGLHPYGLNRHRLEKFVERRFEEFLIVRLPGLVGPGLKKNVIFDFLNQNNLDQIDSRGMFQFYPMVNLWPDIEKALEENIQLIHLTAEPISVAHIARYGFGFEFDNPKETPAAHYDLRSRYSERLGGHGPYQYSARETFLAIRAYAQSEAKTLIGAS